MDKDLGSTRETSQEEDRFWTETERQFFINPNPSLIVCLKNHVWHCRYIAKQSRLLIIEQEKRIREGSEERESKKVPKISKDNDSVTTRANSPSQKEGSNRSTDNGSVKGFAMFTTNFRIKNKHGSRRTIPMNYNDIYQASAPMNGAADLMMYSEDGGFTPDRQPQLAAYDEETYYNPIVNGKHDGKLKLPVILTSQAPDGIRISLYCTDERYKRGDIGTGRRPGFKTNMLNDMLSPEQIPEVIYGPSPVWSRVTKPRFRDGKYVSIDAHDSVKKLENIRGAVVDPVWVTINDNYSGETSGNDSLMGQLGLTDISPPCSIDYSPKLFKFVETKGSPLCRRCLGMAKVACPLCKNMDISNHIPGVGFSNPVMIDHKYELLFNGIDIYHARAAMGTEEHLPLNPREYKEIVPLKSTYDDEMMSVLKQYVETLEQIDCSMSTLLKRVEGENKPNYDYWSEVESKMIKNYIEQYNNKMMDTRYTYNTQRQSCDVLRIRLTCSKSSKLPPQWTEHALCSVCGSDEDWDDDPILFCDCCYIPMHYCCLGYKPGTMYETTKKRIRRHTLLHTPEGEEPNVDDDEWMCPCCLFLLDQLGFLDEEIALKVIRTAAGPRNKQEIDLFRANATTDDDMPSIDITRLPYVLGFEYDDPQQRIDLCTVYRRSPSVSVVSTSAATNSGTSTNNTAANASTSAQPVAEPLLVRKLTFSSLVESGNIPTTVAFNVPDEDIDTPFEYDFKGFETDVLGRTINQFWSFKGMTKAQLEVASDVFDEMLVRHMKDGNLDGMVKLLKYVPPGEENMHSVIQHDRAIQMQRPQPSRRGRKPLESRMERQNSETCGKTEAPQRTPGQFSRDDIYTMNSRNPLKRLVISVRVAKNFFVNLKIPVCVFCGFDAYYPGGGPMKRTSHMGTWGHVRCALAVECVLTPREIDYETYVPKVKALKCMVCHNMSTAILQCSHGSCCKAFHVSCAAASSCCLFTWDQNGRPDILCPQHASGLAPTVLLRKLQAKVQYRNYRKMSTLETSLDSVNPKDDVYLTHFLEPNYRSIASVIERVLDLDSLTGFPLPLFGDEVVTKPPNVDKGNAEPGASLIDRSNGNATNDSQRSNDTKPKPAKRAEVKLPLRDKAGKFKVADRNKDANKSTPGSQTKSTQDGEATTAETLKDPSLCDDKIKETKQNNEEGKTEQLAANSGEGIKEPSTSDADDNMHTAKLAEAKTPDESGICRITNLSKEDCFWCSVGNDDSDESVHYRAIYDDRCPSAEQVGHMLFADLAAAKRGCSAAYDHRPVDCHIPFEGIPPLVWSEICASSRIVDEKMLHFVSDDFIGGQRLISELVSKSCRYPLLGVTRLLNILYFKSKDTVDMPIIFDRLLKYMRAIQAVDEARRNCEIGTNSAGDMLSMANPMSNEFPVQGSSTVSDNRKECRSKVNAVLRTLNQSSFTSIDAKLLPNAILRISGPNRSNENNTEQNFARRFAVCSGCLEFKSIDQHVKGNADGSEKCVLYSYHYKTCRICNVRACNECISLMRSSRSRYRLDKVPPLQPSNDTYMSAASLLSQPMYHMNKPMPMPRHPPSMDEQLMSSRMEGNMPLPMIPRSPMMDRMGCHPPRGMSMNTPLNVDPRMSSLMAASIQRGQMNPSCQNNSVMPRPPRMVNPVQMMNPNMGDMPSMSTPKVGSMPMCGMIPMGLPNSVPMYNGTSGKTIPMMNDRGETGNSGSSGNAFGKAGPMIKSPPVKNGPFVGIANSSQAKESNAGNGGEFIEDDDSKEGGTVITKAEQEEDLESGNDSFICCRCEDMENDITLPLLCCVLCSRFDGLMIPVNKEHLSFHPNWNSEYCGYSYVHVVCLNWLTYSKVVTTTLRKFPKAMSDAPCHYCGVACGATMLCSNNYCSVRFHASCGAWLGCKVDNGKRLEGNSSTSRRVHCLRHTLVNVTRMSQAERKFILAPPNLYELLIATPYHISGFFSGVYLSRYCVPNKMKADPNLRPVINRPQSSIAAKRPKPPTKCISSPASSLNTSVNMLGGINYMNLGLVLTKNNFGQPINDYNLLPDNIARDRLIQALNWTAYNSMNLVGGRRDMKEIKVIIQLIKAGQLKPIHGSKRGRKPKSLDGSNFDNRQKMPMEDILTYCHSGQLDSGEFFCPVCFSIYFECSPGMPGDDLHWIGCDGCERWFHFVCAGVWAEGQVDANSPSWYCLACTRQRRYRVNK